MNELLNDQDCGRLRDEFLVAEPFNHVIIDNFWNDDTAKKLVSEFPNYDSSAWTTHYNNPLEDKKTSNHWDKFPGKTYQAFTYLNSQEFVTQIEYITGQSGIKTDVGLHGGGWHCHHKGGKLNIHLDYSIHPKLKLERHFNLIIYMTPNWNPKWHGGLELWSHNQETDQPLRCETTIENKFNRALLFDTTQHSWHGLPDDLTCPVNVYRQSMAIYYLTNPSDNADPRNRALFVPHGDQGSDASVLEFIKKRSNLI
jgi:Rps23 Pro-64 3,4-dihydroxylase Tpa1-like proline 4-hydroxylase